MRRQITLLVVLTLLLTSLAGCGSSATDESAETTDCNEIEKVADEDVEEESAEVEAEEEDVQLAAPQLSYTTETIQGYTVDGVSLYVEYVVPAVADDDHELLAAALEGWAEEQLAELQECVEDYGEYAPEAYGADDYFYYSISQTISATYVSGRVVSLYRYGYDYLGGTHPNTSQTGVIFDALSGEQLSLTDLLEDVDGFYQAALSYVMDYLETNHGGEMFDDYAQTVEAALQGEANFYLDAEGICLIFDTYELGPYAMGPVEIVLPYEEYGSYLKGAYVGTSGSCLSILPANTSICWELGSNESTVTLASDGASYGEYTLTLCMDGYELELGTYYGSACNAYILRRADARTFVLVDADYASNDNVTFVVELTEGGLVLCDQLEDAALGQINTESLTLELTLDVLGTYSAVMTYELSEDGTLQQLDDIFVIAATDTILKTITVTSELPVTIGGQAATLPVGTRFVITSTDNAGTAYFRLTDSDTEGSISYTRGEGDEEYMLYIDGVSEYDCLEGLPYAG